MITKIYWATRILAYLACLGGVVLHMYQMQGDPRATPYGLPLIGLGFIFFFVSYALRAWIRFAPRRTPPENPPE